MREVGAKAFAAALAPTHSALREPTADEQEEPDVKRGRGALRDIQRLLWLARLGQVGADSGGSREIEVMVPPVLADARRFLWKVRCHLHLLAGRPQDRLVRELQPLVARRLGLGRGADGELLDLYHEHTSSVSALLTTL